jgi:hypothetical protein
MGFFMYQRHYRVPLSYDLTSFQILGQNLSNFFVGILVQATTPKEHFEINWPLAATTVVLCLNHYLPIVTSMNKSICFKILLMIFKISIWLCLGLQIFTTIATRNHYTVDIWLATLFSYMNWTWHYNVILKRDPVIGKMKYFSNEKIY